MIYRLKVALGARSQLGLWLLHLQSGSLSSTLSWKYTNKGWGMHDTIWLVLRASMISVIWHRKEKPSLANRRLASCGGTHTVISNCIHGLHGANCMLSAACNATWWAAGRTYWWQKQGQTQYMLLKIQIKGKTISKWGEKQTAASKAVEANVNKRPTRSAGKCAKAQVAMHGLHARKPWHKSWQGLGEAKG